MATAFTLSVFIATAVLAIIARPFFSSEPPPEEFPGRPYSRPSTEQYPAAWLHPFSPTVRPQEAGTYTRSYEAVCPCDLTDHDSFRARFSRRPGASVQGRPAGGGIYTLDRATGVELDFLQLDRFRNTERPRGAGPGTPDEEAHCARMRQLGALWWPSIGDYLCLSIGGTRHHLPYIKVGWPAGGGIWVLNMIEFEAGDRGVAIIDNAYNMEERCKALEQLGAVFYQNPKDCPDLDLP